MYALSDSAEGDCYCCVRTDPSIAAAALGASEFGTLPGIAPAQALHTFTLDSSASRCFFHDSTTLTPLRALVSVRLANPSRGPVVARSSTVLPCPARVSIFTWTRTGRHLATFTRRPGSSLYTLATKPPQVAASAQVSVSGPVSASPPHSRALPCLPCVEGQQRAAPHSSSFPSTAATLQTLHMDVWGPAHVSGQGRERYFLLLVDDYTRYTTVFAFHSKGEVIDVLIPWIRTVRLQLREQFSQDLLVLRLHYDIGGSWPSGVSQVDPLPGTAPVEVPVGLGAARGAASGGASRPRPPPVPGMHAMALRPYSIPQRVPRPTSPESSLPENPSPESGRARAACPTISRLLATAVTDPFFESAAASALVAELLDFATAYRLDYTTAIVAEFAFASPPSVGGGCALGTDVLEDR
ncbi:unnamed protein product [Closterium sp. NIES-54]